MSELPKGWTFAEIGDVAKIVSGGTPKASVSENFCEPVQGGHAWLTPADLSGYKKKFIKYGRRNITEQGLKSSSAKLMPEGSVVFSSRAPIGYVAIAENEISTNQGFKSFVFDTKVHPNFAYYYLKSIRDLAESWGTGTTFKELSGAKIKKLPFIYPELDEQKRIADKLDSVLAKVEAAQARLDKIPTILKRFRQSVLAAATSGELTKDWREDNEFTIKDLIRSIEGKVTDKKALPLANREFDKNERTVTIPQSWRWVRLSGLTEIVSGVAKGSKSKGDLIALPYLRVANVQRGYLDLSEIKEISVTKTQAEKLYLKRGDILFNEGGDIDKLGRGWIWEGQIEHCIHQNHVFRARVLSEFINPKYISIYGNEAAREYFFRGGSQTVNLANLNKTTLSLLPVPVPPSEEQNEIVRRVDELLAQADTVEKQYIAAKVRLDKLTQSILAKAFHGELI